MLEQGTKGKPVNWEWTRKTYHSVQGVFVCYLYNKYPSAPTHTFLPLLLPPFLAFMYLDHLRLHSPTVNTHFIKVCGRTMRPAELHSRLTSSSAYMAGVLLSLCWFTREVAFLSILFLAWVDSAAAFGGRFGSCYMPVPLKRLKTHWSLRRRRWEEGRGKSVWGWLAGSVTGALIYAVYKQFDAGLLELIVIGLIAGLSELITIEDVDDDLSLPLFAGLMMTMMRDYLKL